MQRAESPNDLVIVSRYTQSFENSKLRYQHSELFSVEDQNIPFVMIWCHCDPQKPKYPPGIQVKPLELDPLPNEPHTFDDFI